MRFIYSVYYFYGIQEFTSLGSTFLEIKLQAIIDHTIYISTMVGIATMFVNTNNPNQIKTKVKGNLLDDHFKDLNFRANMGISATNKIENTTPNPNIINGLETIG